MSNMGVKYKKISKILNLNLFRVEEEFREINLAKQFDIYKFIF